MRIVVYGTGGVGGYFGGRLAEAGEDVTFVARGEHLRAIKASGLRVDSPNGDFVIYPARATDNVNEAGETDLVILGVKAWQVPDAARAIKPIVGPTTTVLPLQNGVDAVPQLVAELGSRNVIGGLCRIVSFVVEPGHIRHAGFAPTIIIGELDNRRTERITKIEEVSSTPAWTQPSPQIFKSRSGRSFFSSRRLVASEHWRTRPPEFFAQIRNGAHKC